jgi:DNA-binding MurR/RpiR family transcriptional regulator
MQQKIAKEFIQLYRENQKQPTNTELAKALGVSERTIARHLKSINFGDYFSEQRHVFAPMMSNVIMSIYNSAIKGKVPAQKLMLQTIFGWAEPKSYEQPESIANEPSEEKLAELERGIQLLVKMRERKQG